jgi:predicted glycoside hydrolase/deacetylase ChbG (UPF0249 family)
MKKYKIIINADDLGINKSVNMAILKAFRNNVITSSSLMVNMPGTKDAIRMIKENNLYDRIGLHLNLIEGPALTSEMRDSDFFCDKQGNFRKRNFSNFYFKNQLKSKDLRALGLEVQAQINFMKSHNLEISHVDSHVHFHTHPNFFKTITKILIKNKIMRIRIYRNVGQVFDHRDMITNFLKSYYIKKLNKYFRNHFTAVDFLSTYDNILSYTAYDLTKLLSKSSSIEIFVHPVLENAILKDRPDLVYNSKFQDLKFSKESLENLLNKANIEQIEFIPFSKLFNKLGVSLSE